MTFRRMGSVQAMVYVSGYLNDVCEMVTGRYNRDQVLAHLVDAREMLNRLARDWALEKGYKVTGNLIEPGQAAEPYKALSGLERTLKPEDRRTLRVFESESGEYRDFGFGAYDDAASAQEILQWLDPEPCVGSAIVENTDMGIIMKSWQGYSGKPPKTAPEP